MTASAVPSPLPDPQRLRTPRGVPLAGVTGALMRVLVCMGDQLGLFRELARRGAMTASELAASAGLEPLRADAWLRAMVLLGRVEFDGRTRRFALSRSAGTARR